MTKYINASTLSSGFVVIWGAFAANPYTDLFATNPHVYGRMAEWANEAPWGVGSALLGLLALALYLRGYAKSEAALFAGIFTVFATVYFLGDVGSPAWAIHSFFALANYIRFWGTAWTR